MPRFNRSRLRIKPARPPRQTTKMPSDEGIADFILSVVRTQVDKAPIAKLKAAVKAVIADDSAPKVVNLVLTVVEMQVGEDEAHSPMLVSLVDDLGVSAEEVELAQDIILAGRDITKDIASAVGSGNPQAVLWGLMARVGQLIPELEADINAIKASAGR